MECDPEEGRHAVDPERARGHVEDQVRCCNVAVSLKRILKLKGQLANGQGEDLAGQAVEIGDIKVQRHGSTARMRYARSVDSKRKLGDGAGRYKPIDEGKVQLVAGVTRMRFR